MTETSPPYGDTPAASSTRVSEAELLDVERAPELAVYDISGRLVAEIRRYRTLLIGLAEHGAVDQQLDDNPDALQTCHFCGEYTHDPHKADCVWAPVEAEVQAIREER